jgi:hypothetical protein
MTVIQDSVELVTETTALLWRLDLMGVDVGQRWQVLADRWDAVTPLGDQAPHAWLAMMAYVGARREASQRATLIRLKVASLGRGEEAFFAKECGMAAAQATLAFGAGRYEETLDLLLPLRHCEQHFGEHNGHRDLIDHTLIEAAIRSGHEDLAAALVAERAARLSRAAEPSARFAADGPRPPGASRTAPAPCPRPRSAPATDRCAA